MMSAQIIKLGKPKISQLVLLIFLAISCRSEAYFIGKWKILTVVQNEDSIDLSENWIHLKNDGSFDSYDGDQRKEENGSWSYNNENREILINGAGDTRDSRWRLHMKKDTLFFQSSIDSTILVAIKSQ